MKLTISSSTSRLISEYSDAEQNVLLGLQSDNPERIEITASRTLPIVSNIMRADIILVYYSTLSGLKLRLLGLRFETRPYAFILYERDSDSRRLREKRITESAQWVMPNHSTKNPRLETQIQETYRPRDWDHKFRKHTDPETGNTKDWEHKFRKHTDR
jgi:hypothetical protein